MAAPVGIGGGGASSSSVLPIAIPIARPISSVDFNKNIVSGAKMTGGYSSFQIWPNGSKISPVTAKTESMTLANVDSIFCYKQNNQFDLFLARAGNVDFSPGEVVNLQGPITDPTNGNSVFIQMTGEQSTNSFNFYLTTSTIPGDNSNPPIVIPPPNPNTSGGSGGGQSQKCTVSVTVECLGKVVFSTKADTIIN